MELHSVLLILAAVALYAIWHWVKNRERQEELDHAGSGSGSGSGHNQGTELEQDTIGFHNPTVSG